VAHNGSIVPVPGRDIMVQAWYQGGVSVFDFTDSAKPFEIAYFDRGPLDAEPDRRRALVGVLVQRLHLRRRDRARPRRAAPDAERAPDENELAAANAVRYAEFNAQHQPKVAWPTGAVAQRRTSISSRAGRPSRPIRRRPCGRRSTA
jgi:hypothetical protein